MNDQSAMPGVYGRRQTQDAADVGVDDPPRKRRTPLRFIAGSVVVVAAALGVAACGSSEPNASNSGSSSAASTASGSSASSTASGSSASATETAEAGSGALAEAEENVKALEERPTEFTVPALPSKPKAGQQIDFMACGLPVCIAQQQYIKEAAQMVGWKFKFINLGLSPSSVDSGYEEAVREHPAGIIGTGGFPPELFAHQLAKLKEEKVPVMLDDTVNPKPGVTAIYGSTPFQTEKGEEMGQWILADAKGENAHVGIITTPATPVYSATHTGLKKYINSEDCKSCSVTTYEFPEENIGTKLPTEVVSFLRTHAEINYLFFDFADETQGVPSALQSAGLAEKVKITYTDSGSVTDEYLKNNKTAATAADPWPEVYWNMFNTILRVNEGVSIKPAAELELKYPRMIFTPTNVIESSTDAPPPLVESFQEAFKKAWHVG